MSFLVKIPIYIYHDWLLKAHVETYHGLIILASIILKLSGILRLIIIFKIRFNYLNKILIIN